MKFSILPGLSIILLLTLNIISCGKEDPGAPPTPGGDCASSAFAVTATSTNTQGCAAQGSITAAATNGSGAITYKLDLSGTYQSSPVFSNLAAGSYTVFARNGSGCEKTTTVTITSDNTEGPLFGQVKQLLSARCVSCHNATTQNGGQNFSVSCNIVSAKTRINTRAVVEGTMPAGGPPLTQAEKDIITNWLNAGGNLNN